MSRDNLNEREPRNERSVDERLYTYRWIQMVCKMAIVILLFPFIHVLVTLAVGIMWVTLSNSIGIDNFIMVGTVIFSLPLTMMAYKRIDRKMREPHENTQTHEADVSKEVEK